MRSRVRTALRSAHDAAAPEILRLGDERAADAALAGGKAASLSALAARYDVPPGFVVALPGAALDRAARGAGSHDRPSPAPGSPRAAPAPAPLAPLAAPSRPHADRSGAEPPPVAVRSSAIDEDGAAA